MSEWQPIETAPKDGTYILGFCAASVMIVYWSGAEEPTEAVGDNWYERDTGFALDIELTHWMPLPAFPGAS